jgi:transposase
MLKESSPSEDIETLKRQLAHRDELIAKLLAEIARLKRGHYGRSSERLTSYLAQLQLALDDLQENVDAGPETPEPVVGAKDASTVPSQQDARVVPFRRAPRTFPAHLPREIVTHEPASCTCAECGAAMRKLGEDISEMLDFVPGYMRVLRHIRPKLSCPKCSQVVQAPAPSRPIERGIPTASLLAHVVVSKYADHTPLYRQCAIFRRAGVELDRATLAAWTGQAARLVDPLANAIGRYVLAASKVHADDTPVPVLDPGRGKTKTGRLWTYVRDDRPSGSTDPPAVWYRYSPDRKGEHPRRHLRDFEGILQADGYAGYASMYEHGRVVEAACFAHARRKFYDIYVADQSPTAAEAIRRIGLLYAIEREIRGQLPEVRRAARQVRAVPILEALYRWLGSILQQVSARSTLANAIKYSLARWTALTRYCDDGRIEIDNNSAERSIRPLVLGRRNYLFAGSDNGGESAATLYTLIGTAMLNNVEPYAYLRTVFERIADHPINHVDEFLPWRISLDVDAGKRLAA